MVSWLTCRTWHVNHQFWEQWALFSTIAQSSAEHGRYTVTFQKWHQHDSNFVKQPASFSRSTVTFGSWKYFHECFHFWKLMVDMPCSAGNCPIVEKSARYSENRQLTCQVLQVNQLTVDLQYMTESWVLITLYWQTYPTEIKEIYFAKESTASRNYMKLDLLISMFLTFHSLVLQYYRIYRWKRP